MGMYSWMCKGDCGKAIKGGEETIEIKSGEYGGYGNVDDGEPSGCMYHKVCFLKKYGDIDTTEGEYDDDQGMGYPDPEFLPAGTKLYDERYDALQGVEKVGLLIDLSGGSFDLTKDAIREAIDVLSHPESAVHYLGVKEIELITFDTNVLTQETLPADHLSHVRHNRSAQFKAGGGTDVRSSFEAAVKAGCGAIIVVSDLMMGFPDDPGVPVIWLGLMSTDAIERNVNAGEADSWKGLPMPPYGTRIEVGVYSYD